MTFQFLDQKHGTVAAFEYHRAPFHTQTDKSASGVAPKNPHQLIESSLFDFKFSIWWRLCREMSRLSQTARHHEAEAHVDAFSEHTAAPASIGGRSAPDGRRPQVAVPLPAFILHHSTARNPVFVWRIPSMPLTLTGHWYREGGFSASRAAARGLITQHTD